MDEHEENELLRQILQEVLTWSENRPSDLLACEYHGLLSSQRMVKNMIKGGLRNIEALAKKGEKKRG